MAVRNPVIDEGHFAFDTATLEATVGYDNQPWSALTKIGVPEAPKDGKPYFMINGEWVAANNVIPDAIPSITSLSSVNTELGSDFTYQITAAVDDEPVVGATYSITGAPTGMTVNSATGVVSWSVPATSETAGSHTFTAIVTTQDNFTAQQVVTVDVVVPVAFQPSIAPNQSVTVVVNEVMAPYQIQGTNITPTVNE